jgi:hypothetical protein
VALWHSFPQQFELATGNRFVSASALRQANLLNYS